VHNKIVCFLWQFNVRAMWVCDLLWCLPFSFVVPKCLLIFDVQFLYSLLGDLLFGLPGCCPVPGVPKIMCI
jgi:hypothetical protein